MKRWYALGLLLVGLLLLLQTKLWFADEGIQGIHLLQSNIKTQQAQNEQLRQRNQALIADAHDLKHGKKAIEMRARKNLGLIKPGEVFYQVVPEQNMPQKKN